MLLFSFINKFVVTKISAVTLSQYTFHLSILATAFPCSTRDLMHTHNKHQTKDHTCLYHPVRAYSERYRVVTLAVQGKQEKDIENLYD